MKSHIRLSSLALGTAPSVVSGPAAYAQTYENGSGGSVRFYGQFSPTWLSFDDGEDMTSTLADHANSNPRLRFVLMQPMGPNELVPTFETALGMVQTSEVSNDDIPDWIDWQRTDLRKFEAAWSGVFGTVSFGQGSMATDGVAELDASGTTIAGYSSIADVAGGFFFREDDGIISNVSIANSFVNLDGSRRFRLRYDTPDFSGFTFAAAYGQNVLSEDDQTNYYDAALRWSGEAADFEIAAAAGYAWTEPEQGDAQEQYAASASLLHGPTGLDLAIAGGAGPDGGSDGYVKGGWIGRPWSVGETALSVDYYSGTDFVTDGSGSEAFGVSAVQNFTDAELQVYLGWRSYSYDDDVTSYQDAQSLLAGARYRF